MLTENPSPLSSIAATLGVDPSNIRRIALALAMADLAVIVRRGKILNLASLSFKGCACKSCYAEFQRPKKSKRKCCSRSCGIAWSWNRPGVREKRCAGIRAERKTPAARARLDAHNQRRWSKPGEREKLSEQNRREWSDPEKRQARAASIRAVNGSAEFRKLCSDIRKAYWQKDSASRDEHLAAITAAMTSPEMRAKRSAENQRRYRGTATRERYLEVSRKNIAKATAAITGKKKSPESISKRVASFNRTMAAKRAAARAENGA